MISEEELQAIRRIWVVEKHEIEDSLPGIYEDETGSVYPGAQLDDNTVFGTDEIRTLRDLCGDDTLHFELVRELLSTEKLHRNMLRRSGIFVALESAFRRNFFVDQNDAINRARERRDARSNARASLLDAAMTSEVQLGDGSPDSVP